MKFTKVPILVFFIAIIGLCSASLCKNASSTSDLPVLKTEQIKFGKGNDPIDKPLVKCVKLDQETLQFNCTLTNRELHNDLNKSCNVKITALQPCTRYLEIDLVYQFLGNKLLLVWHETSAKFGRFYRNLQIIDLDNSCKLSDEIIYPRTSFDWRNLEKLIFYNDSFESISNEIPTVRRKGNKKMVSTTFDFDGNIMEISTLPLGTTSLEHADKNVKNIVMFDSPSDEVEKLILRRKGTTKDEKA